MVRKTLVAIAAVLSLAMLPVPAHAQSQSVNFNIGYFTIRSLDSRGTGSNIDTGAGDIIFNDYYGSYVNALDFNPKDFNSVTFGADYLIDFGHFLEGGVGVSYYKSNVNSVSLNFVNDTAGGAEIPQTLTFRIVPVTLTARFLPLGNNEPIVPYIGAGVGIFTWRYQEAGQFVADNGDGTYGIYEANPPYVAKGTNVGPVILGGVRFVMGAFQPGFEVRWQRATGSFDMPEQQSFGVADKIYLGGISYQATFGVRF
jgi:hypothetical protein